jgi:hypothetical protein
MKTDRQRSGRAKSRRAGSCREAGAQEAVESGLASRRLPSVEMGRYGGRPGNTSVERDYEPEGYRVRLDAVLDAQAFD